MWRHRRLLLEVLNPRQLTQVMTDESSGLPLTLGNRRAAVMGVLGPPISEHYDSIPGSRRALPGELGGSANHRGVC